MTVYRALFLHAMPGARSLAALSMLARLPLGMIPLALILTVHAQTGSYARAGTVVGVYAAGGFCSPLSGRLLDRYGPRAIIRPYLVVHATLLCVLGNMSRFQSQAALLLVIAALAGAFVPPISPAMRSYWPRLAQRQHLQAAHAIEAVTFDILWILGPLLVGAVVAIAVPHTALYTAAVIELAAGLRFLGSVNRLVTPQDRRDTGRAERRPWNWRPLAALVTSNGLNSAALGALEVTLAAFAHDIGAMGLSGPLIAVFSAASFAGGVAYGSRAWNDSPVQRYQRMVAWFGLAIGMLSLVTLTPLAIVLLVPAGFLLSPIVASGYGLVSSMTPTARLGEAFAWLGTTTVVGIAVGSSAAGLLIEASGPWLAFAAAGCTPLISAGLTGVALRARLATPRPPVRAD